MTAGGKMSSRAQPQSHVTCSLTAGSYPDASVLFHTLMALIQESETRPQT